MRHYPNIHITEKDLLEDLSDLGRFDFVYCQEVLHHTLNPEAAFKNLVQTSLAEHGEIAIYVYKKKAPIREFVDDYVRERIKHLNYQEAEKVSQQITQFGKALSLLDTKVMVPDVDILEIVAGEYDVQRLIYHFFMKCYWNPELPVKDNTAINYDWYHPQQCKRYTINEARAWFDSAKLQIIHEFVDHYGITIHGRKNPF